MSTPLYVFYRPSADHPYQTPSNAWVPKLGSILEGDQLVGQSFQNIRFAYSTWRLPSLPGGYVPSQTAVTPAQGEPTGAVIFTQVQNLKIDRCAFENLGSAYALSIGQASQGVKITSCIFRDLSGGAVKLGNVNDTRALSTNPTDWDVAYVLLNNSMTDIALEFRGAAAVFAGYVAQTNISHNTLIGTGYTGISLGWGWGNHVTGPQTFAADNHITNNRLISIMSALNDGG